MYHTPGANTGSSGATSSPAPPYPHHSPTTALGFSASDCRDIGAVPGRHGPAHEHVKVDVHSQVTSSATVLDLGKDGEAHGQAGPGARVEGLEFVPRTPEGSPEVGRHPYAMH